MPLNADAVLERLATLLGDGDLGGLDERIEQAAVTTAAVLHVDGAGLMLAAVPARRSGAGTDSRQRIEDWS